MIDQIDWRWIFTAPFLVGFATRFAARGWGAFSFSCCSLLWSLRCIPRRSGCVKTLWPCFLRVLCLRLSGVFCLTSRAEYGPP